MCTTKKIAISDGQSLSQQHKKPMQISIADGKRPSMAVGKCLVGNTILPTRPLLTLIFETQLHRKYLIIVVVDSTSYEEVRQPNTFCDDLWPSLMHSFDDKMPS